jgi:hypothetical protein
MILPIGTAPRGIATISGFLPRQCFSAAASCSAASARSAKTQIGQSSKACRALIVCSFPLAEQPSPIWHPAASWRIFGVGLDQNVIDFRRGLLPIVRLVTVGEAALGEMMVCRFAHEPMAQVGTQRVVRAFGEGLLGLSALSGAGTATAVRILGSTNARCRRRRCLSI